MQLDKHKLEIEATWQTANENIEQSDKHQPKIRNNLTNLN